MGALSKILKELNQADLAIGTTENFTVDGWQPGIPVVTESDIAAWETWKKARKLELQRDRRAKYPRIDFYPSKEARAVILGECWNGPGGDYSSTINRIILEWAGSLNNELPE